MLSGSRFEGCVSTILKRMSCQAVLIGHLGRLFPDGCAMSLHHEHFPDFEPTFSPSPYTGERAFRLLVSSMTKGVVEKDAEGLLAIMQNPPTTNTNELFLLYHAALNKPWELTLEKVVEVAQVGMSARSVPVMHRYQQALDYAFHAYLPTHPQFSQHLIDRVVLALPDAALFRVLAKGLSPTDDPWHTPGDRSGASIALCEAVRVSINRKYPDQSYFVTKLSPSKNRSVYQNMKWREALGRMSERDQEGELSEGLGL